MQAGNKQFTNHKTTTTMKETIFSVIDYINRQGIDNSCWGLQTIYEECQDNNTAEIFGTLAKVQITPGTYLYLYGDKSTSNELREQGVPKFTEYEIDDEWEYSPTPMIMLWKIF